MGTWEGHGGRARPPEAEGRRRGTVRQDPQAGRPRLDGQSQAYYLVTPDGSLLASSNAVTGDAMKPLIATALRKYDPTADVVAPKGGAKDPRFAYEPQVGWW